MKETCSTCKHYDIDRYSEPCWSCKDYCFWQEPETPQSLDETQCWLNLTALYSRALMDCEGCDEDYYEYKMEQFKHLLNEFKTAITIEERKKD